MNIHLLYWQILVCSVVNEWDYDSEYSSFLIETNAIWNTLIWMFIMLYHLEFLNLVTTYQCWQTKLCARNMNSSLLVMFQHVKYLSWLLAYIHYLSYQWDPIQIVVSAKPNLGVAQIKYSIYLCECSTAKSLLLTVWAYQFLWFVVLYLTDKLFTLQILTIDEQRLALDGDCYWHLCTQANLIC